MAKIQFNLDVTVSLNSGINRQTLDVFTYLTISAKKEFLDLSFSIEKSSKRALLNLLADNTSIVLPLTVSLESTITNTGETVFYPVVEYLSEGCSLVFIPRDKSTKRTLRSMLEILRESMYNDMTSISSESSFDSEDFVPDDDTNLN